MRCSSLALVLLLSGGGLWAQDPGGATTDAELGLRRDLPAPAQAPRAGTELEQLTQDVSEQLRCPMCQGMSVADSPSASAQAIKDEVRSLLAEGFSQDQVKEYFEGTYGEFVLLSPKRQGLNWLLWLAPGAVFLGGLAWFAVSRRATTLPTTGDADSRDEGLDEYLAQVRKLTSDESASEGS